jgi:hypothetical protein
MSWGGSFHGMRQRGLTDELISAPGGLGDYTPKLSNPLLQKIGHAV